MKILEKNIFGEALRIKRMNREAACMVFLRKKGHSINGIAKFLGRSNSMVHAILKFNGLTRQDLRKIPSLIRVKIALANRFLMEKYRSTWEKFIFETGDKPP